MGIYRKKISVLLTVFVFFSGTLTAQTGYGFDAFIEDAGNIIAKPFNWDSQDLLTFGGIVAATTVSIFADRSIKNFANENGQYKDSFPFKLGKFYGEVYPAAILTGGSYLGGLLFKSNKLKKIGFELFETLFFAGTVTTVLKYSLGRERPTVANDPYNFAPFSFKGFDFRSFSSGHAAVAFSLSTVLAENVNNNYLKVLIYIPAILTATSRVYQNYHWTSDVIAGSAIGYFIGKFVTSLHSGGKNRQVSMLISPEGIIFSYRF